MGGGLVVGTGGDGSRMDGGGEGDGVNIESCGEANSVRHLSASESHGGDGGWYLNCKSCGRSPQPQSSSHKEGLEGSEEATLMGLDEMAS